MKLSTKKSVSLLLTGILSISQLSTIAFADTPIDQTNPSTKENILEKNTTDSLAKKYASTLVNEYGATSVQYALLDNGEFVTSGQNGVFSIYENIPLNSNTMYGIGSTSKLYSAVAIMKLVDMEKLELDKPIINYISDFKMADERYKKITPRMLLNHSSGIVGTSVAGVIQVGDTTRLDNKEYLKFLEDKKLKSNPGDFSVYNNDGFILADILVEYVSNMSFTEFVHKYITEPIGLKYTKTGVEKLENTNLANGYLPMYDGEVSDETLVAIGAGGIYSTSEETCKFGQIFMKNNNNILSKKSIEATTNKEYSRGMWPDTENGLFDYGLGWDSVESYPFNQYGIKVLAKGGDTLFHHNILIVAPEYNISVNVASSGGSSIFNKIVASNLLLQRLKEKGVITETPKPIIFVPPVKATMPQEILNNAGLYADSTSHRKINISKDGVLSSDGSLKMIPSEQDDNSFIYTKEGFFVSKDGSTKLKFVKEKNKRVYLWKEEYLTLPNLGQLIIKSYGREKLDNNILSQDVIEAWKKRNSKKYFVINEKYSSPIYIHSWNQKTINFDEKSSGYVDGHKIINKNQANGVIELPVVEGRDLSNLNFFEKDGVEYLKELGFVYISEDGIKELNVNKNNVITIENDGYAKWYNISEKDNNKNIVITLQNDKSNVIVFDELGKCTFNAQLSGKTNLSLPSNGKIVFIGDSKTTFNLKPI